MRSWDEGHADGADDADLDLFGLGFCRFREILLMTYRILSFFLVVSKKICVICEICVTKYTKKPQPYVRGHKIGGGKRDEYGKLYVEMDVGKPLLHIETWTLLVNIGEISMA